MPEPELTRVGGLFLIVAGGMGIAFCAGLVLAPRLVWPHRFVEEPRPAEAPDWRWQAVVGVAASFGLLHLLTLLVAIFDPPERVLFGLLAAALAEIGLVAVAYAVLCRRKNKPVAAIGFRWPLWRGHLVVAPVAGYGLAISAVLVAVGVQIVLVGSPPAPQDTLELFRKISRPLLRVVVAAVAVVLAPVAEEVLFRGVLYRWMRARSGPVRAAIVSAALFSAVHLQLPQAPLLFALGLVLAFIVEETRSLWPAILLHMIFNGVALVATWKMAG